MINPSTLQTCVSGLVGFRESLDTTMPALETSLKASSSGLYVNDQHSLITIENIYNCIVNTGLITLPAAWSSATAYTVGQKVSSSGIIYTSVQAGTNQAVTNTLYWTRNGTPMSIYLQEKFNQGAMNLANKVYLQKNLNQSAKSILPDVMLYDLNANIRKTITKSGRFVGFKLGLTGMDIGSIIRKIGLQFNEVQTDFKIYLYNSSQAVSYTHLTLPTKRIV